MADERELIPTGVLPLNRFHDCIYDFVQRPVLFYHQSIMGRLQRRQLAVQ